ncbi:hypothetical protein WN943_000580 [Citrus x changshan-huyou]
MEAAGSCLIDKYSEGLPDTIVVTSTLMSLKPFVRKELWQHNFEVYTVILNPHDRITIAEAADAFLVMDMAHINRLVAASVVTDPFEYRGYINSRQVMGLPFEIIMYL